MPWKVIKKLIPQERLDSIMNLEFMIMQFKYERKYQNSVEYVAIDKN